MVQRLPLPRALNSPAPWSKPAWAVTPAGRNPTHPSLESPGCCSISPPGEVGTESDHSCSYGSYGLGSRSEDRPGGGGQNTDMAGDVPVPVSETRAQQSQHPGHGSWG